MSKSNDSKKPPKKKAKKRRWLRWVFILLVVGGLVYVGLRLVFFLQLADMSLGLSRVPGVSLQSMLVNQQQWTPPKDGRLRPAEVHMALRMVRAIDSLEEEDLSEFQWRRRIADLMNAHMLTRSHYTWIRSKVVHSVQERAKTSADSVNAGLMEMYEPQFKDHWDVFRDSLDEELLIQ